jgi:hypothetical protein
MKKDGELTDQEEKAFRRLSQRVDKLATQILRQLDKAMDGMPDVVAYGTAVDFLATSLMEQDEQVFKWLLGSFAAMKIQDIEDAKTNLHPEHQTLH